jgi:hypothetical protein
VTKPWVSEGFDTADLKEAKGAAQRSSADFRSWLRSFPLAPDHSATGIRLILLKNSEAEAAGRYVSRWGWQGARHRGRWLGDQFGELP